MVDVQPSSAVVTGNLMSLANKAAHGGYRMACTGGGRRGTSALKSKLQTVFTQNSKHEDITAWSMFSSTRFEIFPTNKMSCCGGDVKLVMAIMLQTDKTQTFTCDPSTQSQLRVPLSTPNPSHCSSPPADVSITLTPIPPSILTSIRRGLHGSRNARSRWQNAPTRWQARWAAGVLPSRR